MFKFNFQVEVDEEKQSQNGPTQITSTETLKTPKEPCKEGPFLEHFITELSKQEAAQPEKGVQVFVVELENQDPVLVRYVDSKAVTEKLSKSEVGSGLVEVTKNTDLVAGVYEGGLKIWECSLDLATFVATNVNVEKCNVIELGCGAALPAIVAAFRGAARTDFQDYNDQVIEHITIPNILLNFETKIPTRLFSGDWTNLEQTLIKEANSNTYDVILTSETIYSIDNYDKLISLFNTCLKPDGKIYLAAKIHYFGVGGGLRLFEQALDQTKAWKYSTVKTYEEGVAREILEISRMTK